MILLAWCIIEFEALASASQPPGVKPLLESILSINGKDSPHETVVTQLSEECLASSASLGVIGSHFLPGAFA